MGFLVRVGTRSDLLEEVYDLVCLGGALGFDAGSVFVRKQSRGFAKPL